MFTERELLIMSYAVDIVSTKNDTFYSLAEKQMLCDKIHNVLRATRHEQAERKQNGL
jgi:hypothetical protein